MDLRSVTYTDSDGVEHNAHDYLMRDGNLAVPGGRYGNDTRDCADIALMLFVVYEHANGESSVDLLDGCMSSVVNSADDVCWTILDNRHALEGFTVRSIGAPYPLIPADYFDADEIEYSRELYCEACGTTTASF